MGQSSVAGNVIQPELFPHGIQNERSDIRCHVAPGTRSVYIFRTVGVLPLLDGRYKKKSAGQPGVQYATAEGFLVPWQDIPDIRRVRWHSERWWESFYRDDSTSTKGAKAVDVAIRLLKAGRFPLWLADAQESAHLDVQRGGTDIVLYGKWKIQVKCDYDAGKDDDSGSGTGNLYIQTAELNPLRRT